MAEDKASKAKPPILRWVVFGLAGFCAMAGAGLLALFFTSAPGAMKDQAYAEGKQARVLLKERTVQGNLAEVAAPAEEKTPEPEATPETPVEEEAVPAEEETPEAEPQEEIQEETQPEAEGKEGGLKGSRKSHDAAAPGEGEDASDAQDLSQQLPPPNVKNPLAGALNPDLSETVKGVGNLPKISESGLESWQYYGKKDTSDKARPMIAIIVTSMGLNRPATGRALLLPEEVSLSFSPYAGGLQQQMTRARAYGHEVWLDLPLEPEDYPASDAGPLTLFHEMKAEESAAHLHKLLASATTYAGLVGTPQEVFSGYAPMHDLAMEAKSRGLLVMLRGKSYANPETADHMLYVNRQLDAMMAGNGPTPAQLLVELEASAKEYGYAIGALSDAPELYNQITQWTATLENKGLQLAPATAVIARLKK